MIRRKFALWAFLIPLPSMGAEASDDVARRVFAQVAPSVVTVQAIAADGAPEGQGSGVVIRTDLVATNCHVVRHAESLRVTTPSGEFPARWVRQHPTLDLCLLSSPGINLKPVSVRAGSTLAVGETVLAVGNPLGFGLAVSMGLLATIETIKTHRVMIATAVLSPGSSGGGLFDGDGRLIGITTAVLGTGQGLNLSLSADGLEDLLASGSPPPVKPAVPPPEPRWNETALTLQKSASWVALEKHARTWHQAQPTAVNAMIFQAMAQSQLNRLGEAETSLRQALELDGDSAFAWRSLALVLHGLGRREDRDQALKEADRRQPNDPQSHLLRADWSREQGQLDEAHRHIKESIRRNPGHAAAWRLLGVIETARGNGETAAHAYRVALRLGDQQAQPPVTQAIGAAVVDAASSAAATSAANLAATAQQAETLLAIGIAELEWGRLAPAEDALRKAVGLAPGLAGAWNSLGNVLFKTERLAEAEAAYDKAIALAPKDAELLVNRASLRRSRNQLQQAMEDVRQATALSPGLMRAWREYGAVALQAKDFRAACMALGKLEGHDQATADDLVSLGECLLATGQSDAALKALRQAETMSPRLVRLHLTMAKVLGAKGEMQAALEYENRAIEIDPTNVHAWSGKGYAQLKLGKFAEAVSTLETTVRLAPDFANAWINLGEARLRSREIAQAIKALEKAIALTPGALDARLFLAQAYLAAPLPKKSREQIDYVLERQPNLAPALAMLTMSHLLESNDAAAATAYLRLKKQAPDVARNLRTQAINSRLSGASRLPE